MVLARMVPIISAFQKDPFDIRHDIDLHWINQVLVICKNNYQLATDEATLVKKAKISYKCLLIPFQRDPCTKTLYLILYSSGKYQSEN